MRPTKRVLLLLALIATCMPPVSLRATGGLSDAPDVWLIPDEPPPAPPHSSGSVRAEGACASGLCEIRVEGTISASTTAALRDLLLLHSGQHIVSFHSPGGSVRDALAIGRLLRDADAYTVVRPGGVCASSCVLALMGGVIRENRGRIGIHRAYLTTPTRDVTRQEVHALMRATTDAIRAYLVEMDIPDIFADTMMAVPPQDIRWLSRAELERFRIVGIDASFNESMVLNEARRLGISRQEHMRREQRMLDTCLREISRFPQCREEIMSGRR